MTKKDYVKIAAILKQVSPIQPYFDTFKYSGQALWHETVSSMATMLAEDSPRFDRARFYAACGMESGR